MNITTKKGDQGSTSLYDGTRVPKDDARIELNGELDELNALLGLCKAATGQSQPYETVQRELMLLMAVVARRPDAAAADVLSAAVDRMEQFVRTVTEGRRFDFVLPGRSLADAAIHMARAKVRTCERRLVALQREDALPPVLRVYLNRLSDFLFCLPD